VDGTAKCNTDGCDNGYYNLDGKCEVCKGVVPFAARCSGTDGKRVTQCGEAFPDPKLYTGAHTNQYYLSTNDKTEYICVRNINSCKRLLVG